MKNVNKRSLDIILAQSAGEQALEEDKLKIEFALYKQCYREALSAIINNIQYNREDSEKKRERGAIYADMKEAYIAPLVESNIFAFVGSRGSGKTTAVNEFCRLLHEYSKNQNQWSTEIAHKVGDVGDYRFQVLAPIDASILEAKEDLMEVILASMYQAFQDYVHNEGKQAIRSALVQEIVGQFDEVHRDYIFVRSRKDQKALGESVFVKLNHTSNSLQTKRTLEKLIKNLLKLLDDEGGSGKSYLVVTVDDLDLNLENGYEMLEQLHKYLSNQSIIILAAIKYEQMKLICEKRIVDYLVPEFGGVHKDIYNKFERKAKGLSNDYLLKVLPLSNRIYMPEQFQLYKRDILIVDNIMEMPKCPVKEFLLTKIALKTNIYYDGKGMKKHFCLPDTTRELVAYNNFLNSLFSMEEIKKEFKTDPENAMRMYDQNHDRFNNDIENRMALQILNDEQLEVYSMVMGTDIERRARYTVNFLQERIKNLESQSQHFADMVDEQNYCYTDLLEVLHKLGRKSYGDKALVHCILASFTSEMVREYYSYCHNNSESARTRAGNRLKYFLGLTFGGNWFNDVMPKMIFSGEERVQMTVGYIPDASVLNPKIEILRAELGNSERNREKQIISILSDVVPCMECMMLFFSNCRDEADKLISPKWEFEIKPGKTIEGWALELRIKNCVNKADFDLFGFIGKEVVYDDQLSLKEMHDELSGAIQSCLERYLDSMGSVSAGNSAKTIREFKRKAYEKSIWHEYMIEKAPDLTDVKISFPYFNLDMSYNVMKRVRKKLKENGWGKDADILKCFQVVYGYIAEALREEWRFYKDIFNEKAVPGFHEDFVNSPFIKAFGIICEDEKLSRKGTLDTELLRTILYESIKGLTVNTMPDINAQGILE